MALERTGPMLSELYVPQPSPPPSTPGSERSSWEKPRNTIKMQDPSVDAMFAQGLAQKADLFNKQFEEKMETFNKQSHHSGPRPSRKISGAIHSSFRNSARNSNLHMLQTKFVSDPALRQQTNVLRLPPLKRGEEDLKRLVSSLSEVKFFQDLEAGLRTQVCRFLKVQYIEADKIVFREGEPGDLFYIILGGSVGLYIKDVSAEEATVEAERKEREGTQRRRTSSEQNHDHDHEAETAPSKQPRQVSQLRSGAKDNYYSTRQRRTAIGNLALASGAIEKRLVDDDEDIHQEEDDEQHEVLHATASVSLPKMRYRTHGVFLKGALGEEIPHKWVHKELGLLPAPAKVTLESQPVPLARIEEGLAFSGRSRCALDSSEVNAFADQAMVDLRQYFIQHRVDKQDVIHWLRTHRAIPRSCKFHRRRIHNQRDAYQPETPQYQPENSLTSLLSESSPSRTSRKSLVAFGSSHAPGENSDTAIGDDRAEKTFSQKSMHSVDNHGHALAADSVEQTLSFLRGSTLGAVKEKGEDVGEVDEPNSRPARRSTGKRVSYQDADQEPQNAALEPVEDDASEKSSFGDSEEEEEPLANASHRRGTQYPGTATSMPVPARARRGTALPWNANRVEVHDMPSLQCDKGGKLKSIRDSDSGSDDSSESKCGSDGASSNSSSYQDSDGGSSFCGSLGSLEEGDAKIDSTSRNSGIRVSRLASVSKSFGSRSSIARSSVAARRGDAGDPADGENGFSRTMSTTHTSKKKRPSSKHDYTDKDKDKVVEIAVLYKGNAFGEVALQTDHPRTATVRTKEDTVLATLSRTDYKAIFQSTVEKLRAERQTFLKSLPLLQGVSQSAIEKIAVMLQPRSLHRDEKVYEVGAPVLQVYFVQDGEFAVRQQISADDNEGRARIAAEGASASAGTSRSAARCLDLAVLPPGSVFGLSGYLRGDRRYHDFVICRSVRGSLYCILAKELVSHLSRDLRGELQTAAYVQDQFYTNRLLVLRHLGASHTRGRAKGRFWPQPETMIERMDAHREKNFKGERSAYRPEGRVKLITEALQEAVASTATTKRPQEDMDLLVPGSVGVGTTAAASQGDAGGGAAVGLGGAAPDASGKDEKLGKHRAIKLLPCWGIEAELRKEKDEHGSCAPQPQASARLPSVFDQSFSKNCWDDAKLTLAFGKDFLHTDLPGRPPRGQHVAESRLDNRLSTAPAAVGREFELAEVEAGVLAILNGSARPPTSHTPFHCGSTSILKGAPKRALHPPVPRLPSSSPRSIAAGRRARAAASQSQSAGIAIVQVEKEKGAHSADPSTSNDVGVLDKARAGAKEVASLKQEYAQLRHSTCRPEHVEDEPLEDDIEGDVPAGFSLSGGDFLPTKSGHAPKRAQLSSVVLLPRFTETQNKIEYFETSSLVSPIGVTEMVRTASTGATESRRTKGAVEVRKSKGPVEVRKTKVVKKKTLAVPQDDHRSKRFALTRVPSNGILATVREDTSTGKPRPRLALKPLDSCSVLQAAGKPEQQTAGIMSLRQDDGEGFQAVGDAASNATDEEPEFDGVSAFLDGQPAARGTTFVDGAKMMLSKTINSASSLQSLMIDYSGIFSDKLSVETGVPSSVGDFSTCANTDSMSRLHSRGGALGVSCSHLSLLSAQSDIVIWQSSAPSEDAGEKLVDHEDIFRIAPRSARGGPRVPTRPPPPAGYMHKLAGLRT